MFSGVQGQLPLGTCHRRLAGPGPARNRWSPSGETELDMGTLHFALFPFFCGMAV